MQLERDSQAAAGAALRHGPPRSAPALIQWRAGSPGDDGERSVRLLEPTSGRTMTATIAAVGYDEPRVGDRVLYATDDQERRYVVGLLSRAERSPIDAVLDGVDEDAVRTVEDESGRLLFEYDPRTRRATLHVPDGDLDLRVDGGKLRLSGRDGVRIESERSIDLAVGAGSTVAAKASLTPERTTLIGQAVTIAGNTAELIASKVDIRARFLDTQVHRIRQVAEVIDTEAERIVERARDAYREVSGLSQHRAGRLRWVAEKTASLVGENVLLKARDRMKVRGERIHLA